MFSLFKKKLANPPNIFKSLLHFLKNIIILIYFIKWLFYYYPMFGTYHLFSLFWLWAVIWVDFIHIRLKNRKDPKKTFPILYIVSRLLICFNFKLLILFDTLNFTTYFNFLLFSRLFFFFFLGVGGGGGVFSLLKLSN